MYSGFFFSLLSYLFYCFFVFFLFFALLIFLSFFFHPIAPVSCLEGSGGKSAPPRHVAGMHFILAPSYVIISLQPKADLKQHMLHLIRQNIPNSVKHNCKLIQQSIFLPLTQSCKTYWTVHQEGISFTTNYIYFNDPCPEKLQ